MAARKFIAHQYSNGQQVATIEFTAQPIYKEMLRVVEKKLEKRPAAGYEVVVYWAVGYKPPSRKKAFSYKVEY